MIHVEHQQLRNVGAGSIPAASTIFPLIFNNLADLQKGRIRP
jgi:hypothetical protein